jgi:hypothetical protein
VGTLAGTLGAIPGSILGLEGLCFDSCSGSSEQLLVGVLLGFAGMIGGSSLGIVLTGDALGGKGRGWATVAGAVLGTLGGILIGAAVASTAGLAALIPFLMGPAVGGVIGYELSDSSAVAEGAAATASRPRLVPLVSVSPGGGLIGGLAGRF